MAINTRGLKMYGIKFAAGKTAKANANKGIYTEISYDRYSGEVYAMNHCDPSGSTRTLYPNKGVVLVDIATCKLTQEEIAHRIFVALGVKRPYTRRIAAA